MNEVCKKHSEKPVKIYDQCVGCEVEWLRNRIKELEEENRGTCRKTTCTILNLREAPPDRPNSPGFSRGPEQVTV